MGAQEKELVEVISVEAEKLMAYPYAGLQLFLNDEDQESFDVKGESGTRYEIQIGTAWVKDPDGDIAVTVAACDKSVKDPKPIAFFFIMRTDGNIEEGSAEWQDEVQIAEQAEQAALRQSDHAGHGQEQEQGHDHDHDHDHNH